MGRRGPPAKPSWLKIAQGNPGEHRLNKREPKPPVPKELPEPPAHLSFAARREWQRTGKILIESGILSTADLPAFEVYCSVFARWLEVQRELRGAGLLLRAPNGIFFVNPLLNLAGKLLTQIRQYLAEFGLTPASRSRVSAAYRSLAEDERAERTRQYLSVVRRPAR